MTLYANGIKVVPTITVGSGERYLVEASDESILPDWYRVYSDGWCEQGGIFDFEDTSVDYITPLKTLSSVCCANVTPVYGDNTQSALASYGVHLDITDPEEYMLLVSGSNASVRTVSWETKGFIAEEE